MIITNNTTINITTACTVCYDNSSYSFIITTMHGITIQLYCYVIATIRGMTCTVGVAMLSNYLGCYNYNEMFYGDHYYFLLLLLTPLLLPTDRKLWWGWLYPVV